MFIRFVMERHRLLVICMIVFVLLFVLLPITNALNYQVFKAKPELQNKGIDKVNMTELDSLSVIKCAVQCTHDCACFGFNSIINKCRIYKNCNLGDSVAGDNGWIYFAGTTVQSSVSPESCKMLYLDGNTVSGVYTIYPWDISDLNYRPLQVFCDMDTAGGGWTVVQRRLGITLRFDRDWDAYKVGFGDPNDSYWLGNDPLHQLTKRNVSLYILMTGLNGSSFYKEYPYFFIESEATKYRLDIGGTPTGTLGGGLVSTTDPDGDLRGMSFSTFDQDNDLFTAINCAAWFGGGWWFNACHLAFLNGPSIYWSPDFVNGGFLNQTVMMLREN